MYTTIHKIDALIKAIEIVISKNRHVLLFDEDEILERCLKKLKRLKKDIIKTGDVNQQHIHRFVKIIALLEEFFDLEEHFLHSIDVVK